MKALHVSSVLWVIANDLRWERVESFVRWSYAIHRSLISCVTRSKYIRIDMSSSLRKEIPWLVSVSNNRIKRQFTFVMISCDVFNKSSKDKSNFFVVVVVVVVIVVVRLRVDSARLLLKNTFVEFSFESLRSWSRFDTDMVE